MTGISEKVREAITAGEIPYENTKVCGWCTGMGKISKTGLSDQKVYVDCLQCLGKGYIDLSRD